MLVFFGAAFFAGAFFAGDFFFAGVFFAGTIFLLDFERSIRRYPDRRVVESGNNHEAIGKLRQLYMAGRPQNANGGRTCVLICDWGYLNRDVPCLR